MAATESKYRDVADALEGTTILITGAAGFVGTALLYRLLLDPEIKVKRVLALIRGKTVLEAFEKLPEPLRKLAHSVATKDPEPRLVILTGDCSRTNLGLEGPSLQAARKADIVIHAAGDTRFLLGLPSAMESITDLAYMGARFSLAHENVKTHIHLSTTYVGWFREQDSVVTEDLLQTDLQPETVKYDNHVNTYLHAKTLAEGCINALFTAQTGRRLLGKAARIVRISTLGAAASFPWPGCGANQTSTPVSAALAAVHIPEERLLSFMAKDAYNDILPVDVAANQILALTAAAHRNHSLPQDSIHHPASPANPVNAPGANIPVYSVANGLPAAYQCHFLDMNRPDVKIRDAYVKESSLMAAYRPFLEKTVHFDTSRAHGVLQLKPFSPASSPEDAIVGEVKSLAKLQRAASASTARSPSPTAAVVAEAPAPSSPASSPALSSSSSASGSSQYGEASIEELDLYFRGICETPMTEMSFHMGDDDAGDRKAAASQPSAATRSSMTAYNLGKEWADLPVDCGELDVDVARIIETRFGPLTAGPESKGWMGYLCAVRDEMQRAIELAGEDAWVD